MQFYELIALYGWVEGMLIFMPTLQEQNKSIVTHFNKEFIEQGNLPAFEEIVALDFVNRSAATLNIPGGREGIKDYFVEVLHRH